MQKRDLIPHLFRTEYRKIVAVLCKRFGMDQIETAEDIASDTFLAASQSWSYHEIPPNPVAWLYAVAKNKAKNHLLRDAHFKTTIAHEIKEFAPVSQEMEIDLSPENINDSQLQMMFAICQPSISSEAQIGLSLRILCGFGIDEIADAFLSNKETINKRLHRAKEKLREEEIKMEIPSAVEIDRRLQNVLTTIYLLFTEGYYSTSQNSTIRKELCVEAMRLGTMLVENQSTNKPEANALLALMSFHASRFEARINKDGEMILYDDQDPSLWDSDLISKGAYFLKLSATGNTVSKYHLEAAIAYWSTQKADTKEKWEQVLGLYNQLLQMEYSPVAALNRTFALAKAKGKQEAIPEAEKLDMQNNQFYFMLLGELYTGIDATKAKLNFSKALALSRTDNDKKNVQKKLNALTSHD
ncbi:MAG TPA: sigma-70 family RNA polymerase sigma factor [Cytophagaceae bacterium]|jgi:RNA polymerase sigma factor (sigma-70 family)|nr:sigma-70 family RNA polymerase sigma factor [Cytophagaceae bacterium]